MLSGWPIARRIAVSAVVALSVGVLIATLAGGLSPSSPVKVMQLIASTLAQTQMQAFQMSIFVLLPSILLSGFVFPYEGMPQAARSGPHPLSESGETT